MSIFAWIVGGGLLMSMIALVGSVTLLLKEEVLKAVLRPLVAFAAGSLIGGALFHMLPAATHELGHEVWPYVWCVAGFLTFLALEQFLHWHHSHQPDAAEDEPLIWLILIADGLHNFIGGLSVAASFLISVPVGISAWIAAAAHEVPQELGDFAVLLHGGWSKPRALLFNWLSGMTFLVGGLIAYFLSRQVDVTFLVPFAAGNFLYIGAADLVPEIKKDERWKRSVAHFASLSAGLALLLAIRLAAPHEH